MVGIFPINLTEFWEGTVNAGRRSRSKRRVHDAHASVPPHVALATKEIGYKLLIVIQHFLVFHHLTSQEKLKLQLILSFIM